MDLTILLEKTKEIVKSASRLMLDASFEISKKGGECNIVTTADTAVQDYLIENLRSLIDKCGFFCEEKDVSDTEREYIWVIDPIDGTANFSRGIPECAISVALTKDKEPLLGVVYNPYKNELYSAIKGHGAYLNGEKISVSGKGFENSILCTAMSLYDKSHAEKCIDIIRDAYMKCNDVRRFGVCSLELCYIARGLCELYFEIRIFTWDYMAAYLILEEAGGILRGLSGEKMPFGRPTPLIGANSIENYKILDSIVSKHLDTVPY